MTLFFIYLSIIPVAFVILLRWNIAIEIQDCGTITRGEIIGIAVLAFVLSFPWAITIPAYLIGNWINNPNKNPTTTVKKILRIK